MGVVPVSLNETAVALNAWRLCPISLWSDLARSTIAAILRRHGMEPAPERRRKTTWKEFLAQHWELIVAADFFTVEVWTASIGRNVTDAVDGILNGKRYLIHDRDPLFTIEFQNILASVGV